MCNLTYIQFQRYSERQHTFRTFLQCQDPREPIQYTPKQSQNLLLQSSEFTKEIHSYHLGVQNTRDLISCIVELQQFSTLLHFGSFRMS